MKKGASGRGPKLQRWVAKGSQENIEIQEEAPEEVKVEAKVEKKGRRTRDAGPRESQVVSQEPKEEVITSPLLLEKATGALYDRVQLLRLYGACKLLGVPGLMARRTEARKVAAEIVTEETAEGEEAESRAPGARRALREVKKAEKLAKRKSSGYLEDPDEEDEVPVPETPSGQKIELVQELGDMATSSMSVAANAALMTYLQSMAAFAAVPYGGMGYPGQTTVMLRNIPNRYTRDMLIERLDKGYKAQYDFVYLPIDFNSKCNVGYAFINFRSPPISARFIQEFHGAKTKHCLPGFSSAKVCEVSYARVQGSDANMENLRDEKFIEKLCERPEWQPLFYDSMGIEVPFSKTLGSGSKKRGSKGGATPSHMMSPTPSSFMMQSPYAAMMYPPYALSSGPPPAPPTTLSTVLQTASSGTIMMLRGVPATYTRDKLLELLNKTYLGEFDFIFLPGEAKTEGNRGFAFINFRSAAKAQEFSKDFSEKKVSECFPDVEAEEDKVCDVTTARLESLEKSIERIQMQALQKSGNLAHSDSWHPMLVNEKGETETFPALSASTAAASARGQVKAAASSGAKGGAEQPRVAAYSTETGEEVGGEGKGKKGKDKKGGKGKDGSQTPNAAAVAAVAAAAVAYHPRNAAAATAAGYYGAYPYNYPGYYPGGNPAAYAGAYGAQLQAAQLQHTAAMARAAVAVQAAHLQAQAAASAHAGTSTTGPGQDLLSLLDPLAAAVNPRDGKPLTPEQNVNLKKQVEFYFSTQNLCKDLYLRSHMNEDGWTPLELISQFPQVRKFRATIAEVAEVLTDSTVLEVDKVSKYMRLRNEEERTKWSKARVPSEYRELVSPSNAPQPPSPKASKP